MLMKKILLLVLLLLPLVVYGQEHCKVVSGNGKDIGSEIVCGTEHFYIVDSNENELKVFAKYNLYTGAIIYKEEIKKEANDQRTDEEYCNDLAASKNGKVRRDGFYNDVGYCFYQVEITDDKVVQKEEAKSAHWDSEGNYLYPQVGDMYPSTTNIHVSLDELDNFSKIGDSYFYNFEIDLSNVVEENYSNDFGPSNYPLSLVKYKRYLEENGFAVNDINLMSLSDINSIVERIANKSLPLKQWSDDIPEISGNSFPPMEMVFGDLHPYIPDEYNWLYSTTYWNRTEYSAPPSSNIANGNTRYMIFVSALGKICGSGFNYCVPVIRLGCGIRPIITIPNKLQYLIKTETDGNGTIEVVSNALGEEVITFKTNANKEYELESITITSDSGESIKFDKGNIIYNDDGTISVDKNKFTMPFENVTIKASWKKETIKNLVKNPNTVDKIVVVMLSCFLALFVLFSIKKVIRNV